ncbi:hypothetical protein AAAU98_26155 [Enterocloster citroniae]|uniref:hypothetical protein n=1 Tax=Enterocloster citroniae TaxID=358743 RepID=UPI0032C0FA0C
MQRMICIPSDQYNRMLESYDKAMEELQELREQLRTVQGDVDGAAQGQAEGRTGDIVDILMSADDETLKEVYHFVQVYAGRTY